MDRLDALRKLYDSLEHLKSRCGGMLTLSSCHGRLKWPERGIYFFFEPGEVRRESGDGPRVVRVGTHALTTTSKTSLWRRLSQHAGRKKSGGGNHRGSIFRLLVGEAMMRRDGLQEPASWGVKGDLTAAAEKLGWQASDLRVSERPLEQAVSEYIGRLPFLIAAAEDTAGPSSARGFIERNAIALLSNYGRSPIDPPSSGWLGNWSTRDRVKGSGLWNNKHVDEEWSPELLTALDQCISRTSSIG
jgi:hypothetical protein